MDSKVSYTVVGLFVVTLAALALAIAFWLTTRKHDQEYKTYLVYVHEEVTGLVQQSTVRFNGVAVGFVQSIELDPNNQQLVRLALSIQENVRISTSTVATLSAQGITGVLYVNLKAQTVDAPELKAQPGQPYPVIPSQPSLLMQLSKVLPEMTKTFRKLGNNISAMFDKKNQLAVRTSLDNVAEITGKLREQTKQLDKSIAYLNTTLQNTATASKVLPGVMNKVNVTLDSIKKTSASFQKVGVSMDRAMKTGSTAINNFSNQVVPNAQQVLVHINSMVANLNEIHR